MAAVLRIDCVMVIQVTQPYMVLTWQQAPPTHTHKYMWQCCNVCYVAGVECLLRSLSVSGDHQETCSEYLRWNQQSELAERSHLHQTHSSPLHTLPPPPSPPPPLQ